MSWIMCGFVLRASDETGCGYLIILHLKNIVIQFLEYFLLIPVLGVLICVQNCIYGNSY